MDCPSPLRSVLGVLLLHASCAEVFRDAIFPPPFWAASPSSSNLQYLDSPAYITVFPSFHMAKPAQSALSDLSHKCSHLHSPPDDGVFNAIKPRFSQENLKIFISATSIFLSWPLVTATVSIQYSIAGRIIVLYILPFTAAGNFLSHMIPVTCLYAPNPAWIPFATSFSVPPSICTVDLRYLKSSTLLSWLPSMCT